MLSLFQKPSDNHSKARALIAKVKQCFLVKKANVILAVSIVPSVINDSSFLYGLLLLL